MPNDSADDATFPDLSGPDIQVSGTYAVHNLSFTNTGGNDYTFTGSGTLNLYGNILVAHGQNEDFNLRIVMQNDTTVTGNGTVILAGPWGIAGSHDLTIDGGAYVYTVAPMTYTGTTHIVNGRLASGTQDVFSSDSAYLLDGAGAFLEPGGSNEIIGSLSGGAGSEVDLDGSMLTLGDATDTTFAGSIVDSGAGGGGITKQGTGKLTLTGTNTYTGPTIVNDGTLDVNGSIPNSALTVNSGGTLKGSGTLGSVTVNGTVAPGNSIATLNGDNFEFASGSTLENEISPTGSTDLVNATTSVTIDPGAALKVIPQTGTYATKTYTIISAPSITGTFSSITGTSGSLTYQLKYYPTHVDLIVSPADGGNTATVTTNSGENPGAPATGYGAPSSGNTVVAFIATVSAVLAATGLWLRKRSA